MARVMELVEMIEGAAEDRAKEVEAHLTLVGREAAFVERLAAEFKGRKPFPGRAFRPPREPCRTAVQAGRSGEVLAGDR